MQLRHMCTSCSSTNWAMLATLTFQIAATSSYLLYKGSHIWCLERMSHGCQLIQHASQTPDVTLQGHDTSTQLIWMTSNSRERLAPPLLGVPVLHLSTMQIVLQLYQVFSGTAMDPRTDRNSCLVQCLSSCPVPLRQEDPAADVGCKLRQSRCFSCRFLTFWLYFLFWHISGDR